MLQFHFHLDRPKYSILYSNIRYSKEKKKENYFILIKTMKKIIYHNVHLIIL